MRRSLVLGAVVLVMALPMGLARAADSATITGTVTDGTNGKPVSGIEVLLSQGNTETQQPGEQQTTETDRDGNFTFDNVEAGDPWQYDVGATYEGELYLSDAIVPKPGETAKAKLTVYQTTPKPDDITQEDWVVFIDPDPNGLAVQQDVVFQNKGDKTYVGTGDPSTRAVTSLPVLPGAAPDSFQALGLYVSPTAQYSVTGTTYTNTAPLLPGRNEGTVRYVAPTPEGEVQFPVEFPTSRFTVLAAPGITVSSAQLQNMGPQDVDGVSFTAYLATEVQPGTSLALGISNDSGGSTDSSKAIGAILLAAALLGALFLIVVRLRNPAPAQKAQGKGPKKAPSGNQPKKKGNRQAKPTRPERASADEDLDADLLVAEIAALDLSFEQGLMKEDDYRTLRSARKAELKRARRGDQP